MINKSISWVKKRQPVSTKASARVTQMSDYSYFTAKVPVSALYHCDQLTVFWGLFIYIRNISVQYNHLPRYKQISVSSHTQSDIYDQDKHNNIFKIFLLFMMEKKLSKLLYSSYENRLVLVPKQKTHTESKKSSNILSSITSWWLVAP